MTIKDKHIAILTTKSSWFVPFAEELKDILKEKNFKVRLFHDYKEVDSKYEILFMLSYFKIIPWEFLENRLHKLVIHESDLPKGRGWSPLFWQILEGKSEIPVVLFEASKSVDSGAIYLKKNICLKGDELHDEIRFMQAKITQELCLEFLNNYSSIEAKEQEGEETIYERRLPKNSELDVNKTIKEQFNALRIASNINYPAFFYIDGQKYILKIDKENDK